MRLRIEMIGIGKDCTSAFSIAVIVSDPPSSEGLPRWMQCKFDHPRDNPDLSRMLFAIQKGGTGVLWGSDVQVCEVFAIRNYSETPGVKILVFRFEGECENEEACRD